jgi:glucose-1-phosphate thymidylyltransferase
VVVLGDNIIQENIAPYVAKFREQGAGARILLKEVDDARRFGVPAFDGERIVSIEEKPVEPKSSYAVTGIYMYDARVFDYIRALSPSARGEFEITDVNNRYLQDGELRYDIMQGWWSDAGTFESLFRANQLVAQERNRAKP